MDRDIQEIQDINRAYLLMVIKVARDTGHLAAAELFGLNTDMVEVISGLTAEGIEKISTTNQTIAKLDLSRFVCLLPKE